MAFKKTVLKKGLRIVTYPMENTRALTLLVLVGAGSRYEKKSINGLAHVLEHMAFRGTKKRPKPLDISRELDKIGGAYNAFTGKEIMGFWVKVDSKHLDLSCDIISDIVFHSLFKEKALEKEKRTILEEFNMYLDTPQAYILDLWEKVLYGNQPMGWLTLGEKEVIKKLKRKNLISYFRSQFRAKNSVIVLAGDFQEKEAIKKLTKYFGRFPDSKTPGKRLTIEKQKSPQLLIHYKETDQSHLALGVRAFNVFSAKRHALAVLANILGGNMSSRVFTEVREKRGMAYYIKTMAEGYTDVGYLITHAGVDNKRAEEALKVILKEYKKLTEKKVPKGELEKAKENLKGRLFLGLETSDAYALYCGGQEILKNAIDTPEKECQLIDKVSQDDILKVAREIFRNDKLNLALIGPFKDEDKFKKLLKL